MKNVSVLRSGCSKAENREKQMPVDGMTDD